MKTTIRVLTLVLCLAMLVGVFGVTAFAAETEGQHVVLTHNNAEENKRIFFGFRWNPDGNKVYEAKDIAAKEITWEAKNSGATMWCEFYVVWDIKDLGETPARRVTVGFAPDGTIFNNTQGNEEIGKIPTDIDAKEWNTYTVRLYKDPDFDAGYYVQVLINGKNVTTNTTSQTTQGATVEERFAIHARTVGVIEVDNIQMNELTLEFPDNNPNLQPVAVEGSSTKFWSHDLGTYGTELEWGEVLGQRYENKWVYNFHENTELSYAKDEAKVVTPPSGPSETADPSIIALAAMMLPVSGIGLGALCIRKKEN